MQLPRSPSSSPVLKKLLRETFGLSRFRPGQQKVIDSILQRRNTLAIMPTGSGKSLCYQLPALLMQGMTIVVSPLISLMKDQAEKLEDAGIDAAQVNSALGTHEEALNLQSIEDASSKIIFATPERMSTPEFIDILKEHEIGIFVVDEAHCISQWGHDFRPAYLALGAALDALGRPPVLALTATATDRVIEDISAQLGIDDMRVINTGIFRENLHYRVEQVTNPDEKIEKIIQLARRTEGHGIIYTATVKHAVQLHEALVQAGENAALYHGQLSPRQRTESQESFMHGASRVMVATNAFGMGIDKRDIRFVIHSQIPANLEAYYQESGRAGRDGAAACCTLFYLQDDKRLQQFFSGGHYPDAESLVTACDALEKLDAVTRPISLSELGEEIGHYSESKLQVMLKILVDGGIVRQNEDFTYGLVNPSVPAPDIARLAEDYGEKKEGDRKALERMVFYAQTGFCRWKILTEYFGEEVEWDQCGFCDNCLHPPQVDAEPPAALDDLARHGDHASDESSAISFSSGEAVTVPKFGKGRIVSVEGEKIKIVFPDSTTRTFVRDYVTKI